MKVKNNKWMNWAVPLISIVLGFILGAVIMLIFGYNPIDAYGAMFESAFMNPRNIGEIFVMAAPLIFTALGFSIANAAGCFNIGLSGQALCGWVASIYMAFSLPSTTPKPVMIATCVIAGALAGAIVGLIPGVLRAYFGTSEVIVTIMMNYIVLFVSTYLVNDVMPTAWMSNKGVTMMIPENAQLQTDFLSHISQYSRLNVGIFFAVIALILTWFIMKKTTLGFEIRSVGLNPHASEYAGMNSKRILMFAMILSGALAGIGGMIYGLGTFGNFFVQTSSLNIGFDGMAVSLLGNGTPLGILLSALLFSVLKFGGQGMPLYTNVPTELVDIVIASIIFFIGISYLIRFVLDKMAHRKMQKAVQSESQEGGEL